jgi:hypothetical protein
MTQRRLGYRRSRGRDGRATVDDHPKVARFHIKLGHLSTPRKKVSFISPSFFEEPVTRKVTGKKEFEKIFWPDSRADC